MKRSVMTQSRNATVFSEGEDVGVENEVERVFEVLTSCLMTRVARAGKNCGRNDMGIHDLGVGESSQSSRMLLRGTEGTLGS
jgi:hypothetical protein